MGPSPPGPHMPPQYLAGERGTRARGQAPPSTRLRFSLQRKVPGIGLAFGGKKVPRKGHPGVPKQCDPPLVEEQYPAPWKPSTEGNLQRNSTRRGAAHGPP